MESIYDVIVIGAGAIGALTAREAALKGLNVLTLEKENDVCNATSMANSAIVHSGYDPVPNTNKAKFNVLGNKMYPSLCDDLDVIYKNIGSLTLAFSKEEVDNLFMLKKRAELNDVPIKVLNHDEVKEMEPNVNDDVICALYAPTAGIVDPFQLVTHAIENAIDNGAKLILNEEVTAIANVNDIFTVKTKNNKEYKSKYLIDAAGLYSDKIAKMLDKDISWTLTPRKGEYFVLDKDQPRLSNHVLFQMPTNKGKGVLISETTTGSYLVGPSSEDADIDDLSCDLWTLNDIKTKALKSIPNIPFNKTIRIFSGLRAASNVHDFIIEKSKKYSNFIILGGIESPGLVSAPAIAKYVVEDLLGYKENKSDANPRVRRYIRPWLMNEDELKKLQKEKPSYFHLVCNCEHVSVGEVEDVLSRNGAPTTIKGVKKRTTAGFGRCQGGFCQSVIVDMLAKKYHLDKEDVCYDKPQSKFLSDPYKRNKR